MLSDVVQGMLALEERAKAKDHTPLLTSTTEEGLPAVQGVTTGHWCDGGVGVEELRAGWQSVVQHVENAATIPLDRMQPDKMTPEQGSAVLGDACFITFRCAPAVCTPQRSMHMCTAAKHATVHRRELCNRAPQRSMHMCTAAKHAHVHRSEACTCAPQRSMQPCTAAKHAHVHRSEAERRTEVRTVPLACSDAEDAKLACEVFRRRGPGCGPGCGLGCRQKEGSGSLAAALLKLKRRLTPFGGLSLSSPRVERAPEVEDIIWDNLATQDALLRNWIVAAFNLVVAVGLLSLSYRVVLRATLQKNALASTGSLNESPLVPSRPIQGSLTEYTPISSHPRQSHRARRSHSIPGSLTEYTPIPSHPRQPHRARRSHCGAIRRFGRHDNHTLAASLRQWSRPHTTQGHGQRGPLSIQYYGQWHAWI